MDNTVTNSGNAGMVVMNKPGMNHHNRTLHVATLERRAEALRLYAQNLTQQEIADRLGVSQTCISQYIREEMAKHDLQQVERLQEYRQQQAAKWRAAEQYAWERLEETQDVKWFHALTQAMEGTARLLGINAPQRVQTDLTSGGAAVGGGVVILPAKAPLVYDMEPITISEPDTPALPEPGEKAPE